VYVEFLLNQISKDGKARLLVVDGYGAHTMCPEVIKLFMDRNIHVICMPSHTSQVFQPLDVTCFAPTKHYYRVDLAAVSSRFVTRISAVSRSLCISTVLKYKSLIAGLE
jgi:hypothetical protein